MKLIDDSASLYRKFDFNKIKALTRDLEDTIMVYEGKINKNKIKYYFVLPLFNFFGIARNN